MGIKKNIMILLLFCLIIPIVYAAEQKSYVNINMMKNQIYNASWVNASYFNGSGQYLSNLPVGVGNTTSEMRNAINQSLYYNFTSNSTTWWANVNDWTSGYFIKTVNSLDFNETKLNNTIDARLTSFTFYPITNRTIYGTETGGNNIGNLSFYDTQTFNVTEIAGSNPLEVRINFTGVTAFDNLLIRERYNGGSGHEIDIELWNYVTGVWDNYFEITDQSQLTQLPAIPVPDSTEHISGGVVMLRFNHVTTPGNTQHKFYIDYAQLIDGTSTLTNIAHDSLSGRDNICINHPWICIYYLNTSQLVGFNYWNFTWAGFNKTYADTLYIGVGNATITSLKSYMDANVSSISNNTLFFNGLPTGYFQNGTEIDTANTTTEMRNAVNQSLYYNLTSQMCYYLNNATQDTAYQKTYNSSYLTNSYNSSYEAQLNHNTTSEIRTAINQTLYYNLTSQMCYYLNNATQDTSYQKTFNTSYDAKPSVDTNCSVVGSCSNVQYGTEQVNTTTEMRIAINQSLYYNITCNDSRNYFGGYNTGFFQNGTEVDTVNTTSQMRNAVNQSLYYNMTVNDTRNFNGYNTGFFQNGTEQVNTTTDIRNTINQTLYYNLTSQMCYYLNNATQNTAYTQMFNSSYEYWNNASLATTGTCSAGQYVKQTTASGVVCDTPAAGGGSGVNYWQVTGSWMSPNETAGGQNSLNITNLNVTGAYYGTVFNASYERKPDNNMTYNVTYHGQLGHNTTSEIQTAINQTLYYNFTSQMCYYLNNATQDTSYTKTYNSSYLTSVFNSSYEYWGNITLTNTYNTTYHTYMTSNVSSISNRTLYFNDLTTWYTYNSTYHNNIDTANTTAQIRTAVNQTLYYNLTAQMCYYLSNSTQDTAYTKTYNSSYLTSVFNSSYEYWGNTTLTNTFNATYNLNLSSTSNNTLYLNYQTSGFYMNKTYNDTYHTFNYLGNTSLVIQNDVDWINSTKGMNTTVTYTALICLNQTCLSNITKNDTGVYIYG